MKNMFFGQVDMKNMFFLTRRHEVMFFGQVDMWRLAQQKKGNRRRLWRLAVATHPRTQANEVIVD